MCVCGPAGLSHPVSPLPLYISSEQHRMCMQASPCVHLHNAEQPCLPPQLKGKKKSHSQEATLKYQVLIWQIQATGVFTFQRLRGEKVQMPPWAAQQRPYRDHSHRHGWQTHVCVCAVGGVEEYIEHWAKSLNTLWWVAAGRHEIMQQCWKLAKFVCLNSSHSLSPQTTCTHAHTHTPQTHALVLLPVSLFLLLPCSPFPWLLNSSIVFSHCWRTVCKQLKYFLIS